MTTKRTKPAAAPVETDKPDILAQMLAMRAKAGETAQAAAKLPKVRMGDMIGEIGHNGQLVRTYTVAKGAGVMVQDGTNRRYPVPLDKLTQIGQRAWTYPQAAFDPNLLRIAANATYADVTGEKPFSELNA